ncbi:MAG: hypothetical protein Q7U74_03580, partial [Saprospiraceae bacterium]|nr:hypothetical protein [Saprospiraceae bacterium]
MEQTSMTITELETSLNSFSHSERTRAVTALAALALQDSVPPHGTKISLKPNPQIPPKYQGLPGAATEIANMHCHSFFSYNAYGYSPTGLAWLAKKQGCALMGIVDFDVLDGVDEFLDACITSAVRGSAALETRVYIPEFATREINSPGEPGVYYTMGIGFTSSLASTAGAATLADMRKRSEVRNRVMLDRINAYLSPAMIDYERDVLPLTPSGNATERHMLAAYISAAAKIFTDTIPFWAEKLGLAHEQVRGMSPTPMGEMPQFRDSPKFQNTLRAKVMKRGGVGY